MGKLIVGLLAIGLVTLLAMAYFDPSAQDRRANAVYYADQRAALALERERQAADLAAQRAPVVNAAILVVQVSLLLLAPIGAITLGTMAVASWRRSQRFVRPSEAGTLPVLLDDLHDIAAPALAAFHHTQALLASRQPVPSHLTYAPHFTRHNEPALLPDAAPLLPGGVPTFSELLAQGQIGKGQPLLLGYADNTPLVGDWRDLYSSAVAGVSGSGKTTTLRFLACQSSLHGAKWVILDPHADAGDESLAGTLSPLARAFVCEPASNPRAMLASVKLVKDELDRRLNDRQAPRWPLVLAADEFTSLMRGDLAEPLAAIIERIAQEGRKVLCFALVSGQVWTAERTGGSALRDSLASCYVHRMKRRQANHLLQLGDELPETLQLATGTALLYRTTGELLTVAIPNTTAEDVVRVAGHLGDDVPTMQAYPRHTPMPESSQKVAYDMPNDMPKGSQTYAYSTQAYSAAGSVAAASAEAMRAASLFMGGMDPAAIVQELRGVRSSEGKRYQTALSEILGLVREGLKASTN